MQLSPSESSIPTTLQHPAALRFWTALAATGVTAGLAAAGLTRLLEEVQQIVWGGNGRDLLATAARASPATHMLALISAGAIVAIGQAVLKRLSTGNSTDTTAAIWFYAGRLPSLRVLASALLSIVVVGFGVSLGREGAPKQAAAVFANLFANGTRLSDEQRRLLVACGAGAGMAAAYGVPLGGALLALEVLRGVFILRYVLPALLTSVLATAVAWIFLPNAPTYLVPEYSSSLSVVVWALLAGPVAGLFSVGYVRLITWAERHRPERWQRIAMPVAGMTLLGLLSIPFPHLLGNGRDVSQLAFAGDLSIALFAALLALRPIATVLCVRCGIPGGLFTPSLTAGAMLGGVLGYGWSYLWPGVPAGLFALLGAGAVLAATTQGPISTVVLLLELTGRDRSFMLPLLLIVTTATLVARSIEPRSIYDAKLTDAELKERQRMRDAVSSPSSLIP